MKHWLVKNHDIAFIRCDGALVTCRDGATWDARMKWYQGTPKIYETGFSSAHLAIVWLDVTHPVTECRCSDSAVLAREIEEALKEDETT